jgi:hypothetical protein
VVSVTNPYGHILGFLDRMFCYSVTKMEKNNLQQRYAIKFCVKDFENWRETTEDEPQYRRPSSEKTSSNVDLVRALIQDRRLAFPFKYKMD